MTLGRMSEGATRGPDKAQSRSERCEGCQRSAVAPKVGTKVIRDRAR